MSTNHYIVFKDSYVLNSCLKLVTGTYVCCVLLITDIHIDKNVWQNNNKKAFATFENIFPSAGVVSNFMPPEHKYEIEH